MMGGRTYKLRLTIPSIAHNAAATRIRIGPFMDNFFTD